VEKKIRENEKERDQPLPIWMNTKLLLFIHLSTFYTTLKLARLAQVYKTVGTTNCNNRKNKLYLIGYLCHKQGNHWLILN